MMISILVSVVELILGKAFWQVVDVAGALRVLGVVVLLTCAITSVITRHITTRKDEQRDYHHLTPTDLIALVEHLSADELNRNQRRAIVKQHRGCWLRVNGAVARRTLISGFLPGRRFSAVHLLFETWRDDLVPQPVSARFSWRLQRKLRRFALHSDTITIEGRIVDIISDYVVLDKCELKEIASPT